MPRVSREKPPKSERPAALLPLRDLRLARQAGRLNLPRYFISWSGHVQACMQGWPSRNRGVFPAVDHERSRT